MAFYRPDPAMAARLEAALDGLDADGRPGLRNSLAITWVRYDDAAPEAGQGSGASWNQDRILYPASVVKLFYAVAVEQWLQRDLIPGKRRTAARGARHDRRLQQRCYGAGG